MSGAEDMNVRFLGSSDNANPSGGLCDEYRLSDMATSAELLAARQQIAIDHPQHRIILSLDDFRQARYTSGHAVMALDLDDTTGVDLAGLPAECFENGEHRGYLSTKAEFPIRARNFAAICDGVGFGEACDFGLTLDEEGMDEWIAAQDDPISLLDQPVSALVVPAQFGEEAIAAFPNGYFTCDLGPALNAAVARHFRQAHGYDVIGIGASYLGLWRSAPPVGTALEAVAADFRALYNMTDSVWSGRQPRITAAIGSGSHLWLRYTE
jgi:hypothetical protein